MGEMSPMGFDKNLKNAIGECRSVLALSRHYDATVGTGLEQSLKTPQLPLVLPDLALDQERLQHELLLLLVREAGLPPRPLYLLRRDLVGVRIPIGLLLADSLQASLHEPFHVVGVVPVAGDKDEKVVAPVVTYGSQLVAALLGAVDNGPLEHPPQAHLELVAVTVGAAPAIPSSPSASLTPSGTS